MANQLMLQRPEAQGKEEFLHSVRRAGAIEIKELADDIFLATFTAEPENPRALDAYVSRLREVAGAEISVEPNYIRKVF